MFFVAIKISMNNDTNGDIMLKKTISFGMLTFLKWVIKQGNLTSTCGRRIGERERVNNRAGNKAAKLNFVRLLDGNFLYSRRN